MERLFIVPHTHWDREWYEPFQVFRRRLVNLIDRLIAVVDKDPGFSHFTLDGQTVVLEDYLEVRPENRERLRKAIADGRILVGPWYVLPDENLVSGESIIRNLERGLRISQEFVGTQRSFLTKESLASSFLGYLPDQFGHIGAMPKILGSFGLDTACLWRGAGTDIDKSVFFWKSTDGSQVLAVYLPYGYGNAANLPLEPEALREEIDQTVKKLRPWRPITVDGHGIELPHLLMNGSDHQEAQGGLPRSLHDALDSNTDRQIDWKITTLLDYRKEVQSMLSSDASGEFLAAIPTHVGELRACLRAPLLPGVTSSRHWIKQRDWSLSTMLERYAEPLTLIAGLLRKTAPWSGAQGYLDLAWKYLLKNQPHDSVCGCSVDQVHQDMKYRYDQCQMLVERQIKDALEVTAQEIAFDPMNSRPDIVIFNPGRQHDQAVIETALVESQSNVSKESVETPSHLFDAEGNAYPIQVVSEPFSQSYEEDFPPSQIRFYTRFLKGRKLLGFYVNGVSITQENPNTLSLTIKTGPELMGDFSMEEAKTRVLDSLNDSRITKVRVRLESPGPRKVVFNPGDLPSLGLKTFWAKSPKEPQDKTLTDPVVSNPRTPDKEASHPGHRPVTVRGNTMENEYFCVEVQRDGDLKIRDLAGGITYPSVNRFVDGGDRGDEYNWDPPDGDVPIDNPFGGFPGNIPLMGAFLKRVGFILEEKGPVRGRIRIELTYLVPKSLTQDRLRRSAKMVPLKITTWVSLFCGVRRIEFKTRVENKAKDHRLRVHFTLPAKAGRSLAGCQFENVERPSSPSFEGTQESPETPLGTHPFRRFVYIGNGKNGFGLSSKGIYEYEVIPSKSRPEYTELALTLMRCVGWLSRSDLRLRRGNAGPQIETPDAQCMGTWDFEYAFFPVDPKDMGILSDAYQVQPLILPSVSSERPFSNPLREANDSGGHLPLLSSKVEKPSFRKSSRFFSGLSFFHIEETQAESQSGVTQGALELSSLRFSDSLAEIRFYDTSGKPGKARITSFFPLESVGKVHLSGELCEDQPEVSENGAWEFSYGAYEIVTLHLVMGF